MTHSFLGLAFLTFASPLAAADAPGTARLAAAQAVTPQEAASPPAPPAQPATAVPSAAAHGYLIGPGDVLQVFVWKEPELTREVLVRVDGVITVPLLGDVDAGGRTPSQLGADLSKAYGRFLSAPRVAVGVAQSAGRFYVIGQVARPGDFQLRSRTTVLQGLALAGGLKEFARADGIVIVREEQGASRFILVNYKKLEGRKDPAENVELQPGDTILVP